MRTSWRTSMLGIFASFLRKVFSRSLRLSFLAPRSSSPRALGGALNSRKGWSSNDFASFARHSGGSRNPAFVLFKSRASTRPAGERLTFSARAEKVSKETRPRTLRPSGSCPKGPPQRPGSANCTSLCNSGIGAIHRADPSGPCRPLPPQCNGDPEEPEQRASCAPEPEQGADALRSALPLLLLVISGPRQPRRGHDGIALQGRAQDAREFANGHGCPSSEPRHDLANRRRRRGSRGGVSLVTFLSLETRK